MTILDAVLTRTGAIVAVDTFAGVEGGMQHVSKFVAIPHIPAIIAGRGNFGFVCSIGAGCLATGKDLDGILDMLPALCRSVLPRCRATGLPHESPQELLATGWSERHQSVILRAFCEEDGFAAEERQSYVAPWRREFDRIALTGQIALVELAREQHAWIAREAPGTASGGHFIVATLGRTGMMIGRACDLECAPASVELAAH